MDFDDLGVKRVVYTFNDVAVGTVERGKVAAYAPLVGRSKAWTVGDPVRGIFLTSGLDGQRVKVAAQGSTVPMVNDLLPGESVVPGDALAITASGGAGLADPDNDLPRAALAAAPQAAIANGGGPSIQAATDTTMETGAGVQLIVQAVFGSTNQAELGTSHGTIWTRYGTTKFVPRMTAEAELFVSSDAAADIDVPVNVRVIRGKDAVIPYEEVVITVPLDGADATTQVNLTTVEPSLTGLEAPLDVNYMSIVDTVASGSSPSPGHEGGGPVGTVYIGPSGAAAGVPTTVLHEIALNGDNHSVGQSHVAAYTVPGGFQMLGIGKIIQSGFATAQLWLYVKMPGKFEIQTIHIGSGENLTTADFTPVIGLGSATKGLTTIPAGTRLEYRGDVPAGGGGTGVVRAGFDVHLEPVPA